MLAFLFNHRCRTNTIMIAGFIAVLSIPGIAIAQAGSVPLVGSGLTLQGGGENAGMAVHRDVFNKPCLDIEAASRAHTINPGIYDHVVSVYNRCNQLIKLQVCYYNSDRCVDMNIPARKRQDAVLGVYPSLQRFRYNWREKF